MIRGRWITRIILSINGKISKEKQITMFCDLFHGGDDRDRHAFALRNRSELLPQLPSLKTVHRTVFLTLMPGGFDPLSPEQEKTGPFGPVFSSWWRRSGSTRFRFAKPFRAAAAAPFAKNSPPDCFFNAHARGLRPSVSGTRKDRTVWSCLFFLVETIGIEPTTS